MLLKESEINSIRENKVTFIKNFVSLQKNYDFNFLSQLMEENVFQINVMSDYHNLKNIFQMPNVLNYLPEFKIFFDFLNKLFQYEKSEEDQVDIFFSFVSQVGNPHIDREDVFIIGLNGKTIYRFYDNVNEDYTIEKGDMIFIPKNIKHKSISLTPRIIGSIGFFNERINNKNNDKKFYTR